MGKADYALMAEYHRGYEDGKAARAANEWALHQKRIQVMNKVTKHLQSKLTSYKMLGYSIDNEAMMVNCLGFERYASPFLHSVIGAIVGKDKYSVNDISNGLAELLGVDPNNDCSFVEYDALGNERHKAICELRKLADAIDDGQWVGMYELGEALGFDIYRTHHNPIRKILQLFVGDEYDNQFYEPRPLRGNSIECCILDELREDGDETGFEKSSPVDTSGNNVTVDTRSITRELRDWARYELTQRQTPDEQRYQRYKLYAIADQIDECVKAMQDSFERTDRFKTGVLDAALSQLVVYRQDLEAWQDGKA